MTLPSDARSVEEMIETIGDATGRLLASASALSDDRARESSPLPGWSRGHVLTHVARNADGLRNLLIWAQTGVETPMYPSLQTRAADIEAGAGRRAADLAADVASSSEAFAAHARALSDDAWLVEVCGARGPAHPAWVTLHRRLFEVEVHHVDLGTGYRTADWPDWFVALHLARICAELTGQPEAPAAVLTDATTGTRYDLCPDTIAKTQITGSGHDLLGWLLGRDDGSGLTADPPGPLPAVPPY
jgi:maleylpyruvate isomerase